VQLGLLSMPQPLFNYKRIICTSVVRYQLSAVIVGHGRLKQRCYSRYFNACKQVLCQTRACCTSPADLTNRVASFAEPSSSSCRSSA